MVELMFSIKFN